MNTNQLFLKCEHRLKSRNKNEYMMFMIELFSLSLLIDESYKSTFTKFSLNIGPSQIFDWNQRFTPANTPLF